jgi:uncharacterized protein (TIGR02099 family)
MIHHLTKATRHFIYIVIVLTAIALTIIRLVLIGVDSYKNHLEIRMSTLVGTSVKIGSIRAKMRGVSPELVLRDVAIDKTIATEKPSFHLDEIRVGVNLGEYVYTRDMLASSWVTLVGAQISIYRNTKGEIKIEGLRSNNEQPLWLLQGRQYEILQSSITWQDFLVKAAPIQLSDVNVMIKNDSNNHQINLMANLPKRLGKSLQLVSLFETHADKPTELTGAIYVDGQGILLHDAIDHYLPQGIGIVSGRADIQLWTKWQQGQLSSINLAALLNEGVFTKKGQGSLIVKNLDSHFCINKSNEDWVLTSSRFKLQTKDPVKKTIKDWPDAIFGIGLTLNQELNAAEKIKLNVKGLDLLEVTTLSDFFFPEQKEFFNVIKYNRIQGQLSDFLLYAEPGEKKFAFAGKLDQLSAESLQKNYAVDNISGVVKGTDKTGKIRVLSKDVKLKIADLFPKQLVLNKLQGEVDWHSLDQDWQFSSPSLVVDNAAVRTESRIKAIIPKGSTEQPYIDLQSSFSVNDVKLIADYLPTQIMKESLKNWLSKAFVKGKITQGDLLLSGLVNDFPFTHDEGVFQVNLALNSIELNFHPSWQHLTNVDGVLKINKDNIWGQLNAGQIGENKITKTVMTISKLGVDELLEIDGEAEGKINQALAILMQSPLVNHVKPLIEKSAINGDVNAKMTLTVPLRHGQDFTVDGIARISRGVVTLKRPQINIKDLHGDIKYNNQGIFVKAMQGQALSHPIKIDIDQKLQETLLTINGKADVNRLASLFDWDIANLAEGAGDYQLLLTFLKANQQYDAVNLTVNSTLEGVELTLPDNLSKHRLDKKPTTVVVNLANKASLPIDINYNNEFKAVLEINPDTNQLTGGHMLIGVGTAKHVTSPGIKLEINREKVLLDELLTQLRSRSKTDNSTSLLNEIKVHAKSAYWHKTRLGEFLVSMKRNLQTWQGEIESVFAKGEFQFPVVPGGLTPITLSMEMLNLSLLKQFSSQENQLDNANPKTLINLNSKKTLWKTINLGLMNLETRKSAQGIAIKTFNLEGADQKLTMSGEWKSNGLTSKTELQGQLDLKNADQLLSKLNITKDFKNTKGKVDFKFNWQQSPWNFALSDLHGGFDVNFGSGRILSIEPGFGRVLGIVAMAQWIKRLQMDFSDVFEEGMAFNSIKGHFDLLSGKATTQNLVIDAVPATITLIGNTDLVNQTVENTIKVVPKSTDAVPIAGTIVGGVVDVLGKTLTGRDQSGFFLGRQYQVKGKWDDVSIKPLHANDGILQKTWNSITDFPWIEHSD